MPQRTVYLPDDLDKAVTALGISLSPLLQDAIRQEMARAGMGANSQQVGPNRITRGGGSGISRGWRNDEW